MIVPEFKLIIVDYVTTHMPKEGSQNNAPKIDVGDVFKTSALRYQSVTLQQLETYGMTYLINNDS